MRKFNRALASQDGLKDEDIREYKTAHDYIQQIENLRKHLGSKLVSTDILIENVRSELEKRSFILKEQDLYSSSIGIHLDNFHLLKNFFKQLESYYIKTCKDFTERFESTLIQSVPELISTNEFKQVAEKLLIISKCLPVLNHHLNGKVEENYHNIIKLILQYLNSFSEKANSILTKITLSNTDIEILENYMILLRTAKETSSLQDEISKYIEIMKIKNDISIETIKDLNKIYDEFIVKIIKYFDEINSRIKDLFEKNGNHALELVEQLVIQMEMIRTLPEIESETARTFYHSIQNIRGYMQQWQRDAEHLLDHPPGKINFRPLRRALLRLKKTKWIDRIFPGSYDSLMCHIREELEEHVDQLEHHLQKLDFTLKCPENIRLAQEIIEKIESMKILEHTIPELTNYRDRINQYFLRITKEVFDHIQKTFNLSDKTTNELNQELMELEQIKTEYEQLYPARISLRKFGYSDINQVNHEIENLKIRHHAELEKIETEKYTIESQLNELNIIIQRYKHLTSSRIDLGIIKHDLQDSLNKMIKNTKSHAYWLDGKIERQEDNREEIREINENITKIRIVLNRYRIMELIDEQTKSVLQKFDNEINQILSTAILNGIKNIEIFINGNSFLEAEQCMENLIHAQQDLADHYTSKFVNSKTEELKTRLNNLTDEILQFYDFADINNYSKNPPRDLLDRLKKVSSDGYARYTQVYNSLMEKIRVNFSLAVDKVHNNSSKDRSAKIRSIKNAFYLLPDELKTIFQLQIDQLNQLNIDEDQSMKFD
ncbi:unnamed protein product [Rotaria sordida]|uniref:Uncharacterized protein n=1 Tax=Rotaria sordida TaxID=392033 RepID=A0A815YKY9_9BILA|nr:unnamed protein product [Rotaria sordida]CAF1571033.1 unnamed protein product [Rotaria sordida]